MKILTVSGQAQHGKDTSASIMSEHFNKLNKKCLTIHYADYLKFIAKTYYNWNGEKDLKGRQLLQQLGTNIARERNANIWVNVVYEFIKTFGQDYDYIFIPDTRFPNEIQFLKSKKFDIFSLWVHRKDFDNGLTEEQKNHPSETSLLDYKFDYVISVENHIYKLHDKLIQMIEQKGL